MACDGMSRSPPASTSNPASRLGSAALALCMVARIGSELVPDSGPGLIVDQRRMLAGVELILVRNPTGVDRVREQPIEMPARKGFAAAFGAIPRPGTFCSEPEAVGLFLDPAHAAELSVQIEDAAHGLGLGRIEDQRALARVIAERHVAAHPHALLL